MTTKAEQAEAERKVMARLEARLERAWTEFGYFRLADEKAEQTLAILKASASALFPGRQQRKHVLPALGKMVTAACRVIRGGAS